MAKAALDAGIHYIMVFGWFQAGHDNAYPFGYYANHDWGGEKVLQEKLAECEAMGCHVIPVFLTELCWIFPGRNMRQPPKNGLQSAGSASPIVERIFPGPISI